LEKGTTGALALIAHLTTSSRGVLETLLRTEHLVPTPLAQPMRRYRANTGQAACNSVPHLQ